MGASGDAGKPAQSGLVDMGDIGFYKHGQPLEFNISDLANYPGSFSEIVLNVTWAQLQSVQDGPIDTSVIDTAIDQAEAANVGIKLRVWGGFTAPDWAKTINGPPIFIPASGSDLAQTIGRFWTADYIDAWNNLQKQLAERYDDNPVIRGISNTTGNSNTDEPFVPLTSQGDLEVQAGYTDAAQELTLRAAIAGYAQWSATPLDYTMNLFHLYDSGRTSPDENFTLAVLQQARNSTRLVQAGNHALNQPLPSPDAFIYPQMQADGALDPTTTRGSFQTASPAGLAGQLLPPPGNTYPNFTGAYASWPYAVANGVVANGGDIELWDGTDGFPGLSPDQVQFLATLVAAGNAPATGAPDDGSALGFIAPGFVTGATGTIAFSGVDAVLLESGVAAASYTVTLASLNGGTLGVTDPFGVARGPASGSTLSLSGPLSQLNTVLASLTDTVQSGNDVVRIVATDGRGASSVRDVGVLLSPPAPSSDASVADSGPPAFESNGLLVVGGVNSSVSVPGDLKIGAGGSTTTVLAALAPSAYSTASLAIDGTLQVVGGGAARFSGTLGAKTIAVDSGGTIAGDGTLTASAGGPMANNGTIEAVADTTLGLQRLRVANRLSGNGHLLIDPGATLVLAHEVDAGQSVDFAANSIAQFANDLYSPSTLVLEAPADMHAPITGFTFADSLVLQGLFMTGATYDGTTLTVFPSAGSPLSFKLSGDLAGLVPVVSGQSTIRFVAPTAGVLPSIAAPASFSGAVGTAVLVPDIVVNAPFPLTLPSDLNVTVTLTATGADVGTLSAMFGGTTVLGTTLTLTGTLGTVERSLQTLAYTANAVETDTITVTVSDYAGASAPTTITANINSPVLPFDWVNPAGGTFGDPANWTANGASVSTPAGGANAALFGPGTYTVSGDGAVGEIVALGTTTLTGQITAQGLNGRALTVDLGGALTLAGGAQLTARQQATIGSVGTGLLTVMGGALALTSAADALVIGEAIGSAGTVLNLEQITDSGTVVVGQGGTGALELRGVASSLSDVGADIGQSSTAQGSVTVNGGFWANGLAGETSGGQLTVGDAGQGALIINGMANGITGQVTAFNATIGAQAGSEGAVTLDGGELLVANALASSSTLAVGAGGDGELTIEDGSEVAVGVAGVLVNAPGNGMLLVGGTAGGRGRIQIGDLSALLVYGSAMIGGAAGDAEVTVGSSSDDGALFSTLGGLSVDGGGRISLGGSDATLRANSLDIGTGGVVSGTGTISGLGGGNQTIALASIDNDGSIAANGGELLLYGSVTGTGELAIGSGATLALQAAVGIGQTLAFGANGRALLNDPRAFLGTITGFGADDVLELASTHATGASWSNGILTIDADFGDIHLKLAGTYAPDAFSVQSDGLGGTIVLAGGHGDVHMVTFDGLNYDFQAVGDFVAVQSADPGASWQIQIRTGSFPGATSVTTALAAGFGMHRVSFAVGRSDTVFVDGAADTALGIGAVQDLDDGTTLARLSSTGFQLTLGTGESVTVTNQGDYLDWAVALGPHDGPGSVRGLLGSNTGWMNDFQLPDGTVLAQPLSADQLLNVFAAAWHVAPQASLLDRPTGTTHDSDAAFQTPLLSSSGGGFLHST